ncbi:MAG: mechanosensitive ion channel family protein [Alicyclobacillus sp.]|nr:mechanosensitive ion channel family protein [Alicyclobacillus sp.]
MNGFWHHIVAYMNRHLGSFETAGWDVVKILVLFAVARLAIRVLSRVGQRLLRLRTRLDERRRGTLGSLFENLVRYTVYFILLLTVLPIFGVHIEALLAGAGVAGLAVAFGAQSLLKDFFNGLFILFEDQYGVGDYVLINGTYGQIRSIGLRITVIKVWTGELVVIPNGQITQVTNYSKENSIAVIDVNVGYLTDAETATAIVQKVMDELKAEQENIVGDVSVLGVQAIQDSNYTIRATAECAPYTHFSIIRLAKQRIHQAFVEQGVDLPMQKVVYMAQEPIGAARPEMERDQPLEEAAQKARGVEQGGKG